MSDGDQGDDESGLSIKEWIGRIAHRVDRMWWVFDGRHPPAPPLVVRLASYDETKDTVRRLAERVEHLERSLRMMRGWRLGIVAVWSFIAAALAAAVAIRELLT